MLPPHLRVTAEAIATAPPDRAEIDIGVVSQGQTAQAAAAENARRLTIVIAELKKVVGATGRVETARYSLIPDYRYPKEGGRPEIVGYTASNVVHVSTNALDTAGKIIDTALTAGANQLQRLSFRVADDRALRQRALRDAALKARMEADALASALGVRIVRVLSIQESGAPPPTPRVLAMEMRAPSAAPPTPIEPGEIEMRASVTLTFEVAGAGLSSGQSGGR